MNSSSSSNPVSLSASLLQRLSLGRSFRENSCRYQSLSFSSDGQSLVASTEDSQIIVFDICKGMQNRLVNSHKYGADLVTFTHAANAVLLASSKAGVEDDVRYLSLHDNKFLRYFRGHKRKVTGLNMSPVDDTFVSSSLDGTVRLWDLREPDCKALLRTGGRPMASFDPLGLILGVAGPDETIRLYDRRSMDKGPFATFNLPREEHCEWTELVFAPDGEKMMVCTNGNVIRLVDAFEGKPLLSLGNFVNNKGLGLEACFTPDSKFVVGGATDGRVHVWDADNGNKVCVLKGGHDGPVTRVAFNPRFALMASACSILNLWIPDMQQQQDLGR